MLRVFLFLFVWFGSCATACAQPCTLVPIAVQLTLLNPAPSVSTDLGVAALSSLAHQHVRPWQQAPDLAPFDHSIGLTTVAFRQTFTLHLAAFTTPNGVCMQLRGLDVHFGIETTHVYAAHELPAGSCIQTDVLHHESRHVQGHARAMDQTGQGLQDDLQALGARGLAVEAATQQAAEAPIDAYIKQVLQRRADQFLAAIDRSDADIDTPQEYTRASLACGGALHALFGPGASL